MKLALPKSRTEMKRQHTMSTRKFPQDLALAIPLTPLCIPFVLIAPLDATPVRIILGLPLVLFLPGYSLIAALFAGKDDLDGIERVALSFGLSIAVVPLFGLALNYTPFGIRLTPVLIVLCILSKLIGNALKIYYTPELSPSQTYYSVIHG